MIKQFRGDYFFLSNMYQAPVKWGDAITNAQVWPCNELPYVLAKTLNPAERSRVVRKYAEAEAKQPGRGPYGAKNAGKKITLRADWHDVKHEVMRHLVADKFRRNLNLQAKLLDTGEQPIQEGNTWGDTVWGVVLIDLPKKGLKAGDGDNALGKIIMEERAAIAREHNQTQQED